MPKAGGNVPGGRGISRKRFLELGGAGLAGMAMLRAAGCGGEQGGGPVGVTFTFGPDASLAGSTPVDRALQDMQGELQNIVDQA